MENFYLNNRDCLDSLRLSEEEQRRLLADFAQRDCDCDDERRVQPRIPYDRHAGMVVQMHHPGGSVATYLVRARNLSQNGIGFFHGGFVHQGTRCCLALLTTDGKIKQVEGRVMRCAHVRKHIHDIGVQFKQPIRLADFVTQNILQGRGAEVSQELPQLAGTILHVEDSVSDQELMRFHMSSLGVEVRTASDGLAAMELAARTRFDAVLTSLWLPNMSGSELASYLRGEGYAGPIIAITADEREDARAEALSHGCSVVLIKPYSLKKLADIMAQYLPPAPPQQAEGGQDLISEFWGNHRMQPLIREYVQRLDCQVAELDRLIQSGRKDLVPRKLCLDIKGSAGGYGYPQISNAAQHLLRLLEQEAPADALRRQVGELARLVRSALAYLNSRHSSESLNRSATEAA